MEKRRKKKKNNKIRRGDEKISCDYKDWKRGGRRKRTIRSDVVMKRYPVIIKIGEEEEEEEEQ